MLSLGLLTFLFLGLMCPTSRLAAKPPPKTMLGKTERMIMLENKRGSA